MEAIMYAAGVGRRLRQGKGQRPKILLDFGGRTLLERHVSHLAASEISRLTVVTGFARDQVVPHLVSLARRYPVRIEEVVNSDYTEGSVLSFAASIPLLERQVEPVLLMDGDVLYPTLMLRRLLHSEHPTALLVDRGYSSADDDPLLVPIIGGRPADLVKGWRGEAEAVGESVGFFKVDPRDLPLLIEATRQRQVGAGRAESYDEVLRVLVRAGRFGHEDVTGLPWMEIDFPQDVIRAEEEVVPAVEALDRSPLRD